jgi:hypothetical protein
MRPFEPFNYRNPSILTLILSLIKPLTEMSIRNLPGGNKARPARKADNLTAICEPIA